MAWIQPGKQEAKKTHVLIYQSLCLPHNLHLVHPLAESSGKLEVRNTVHVAPKFSLLKSKQDRLGWTVHQKRGQTEYTAQRPLQIYPNLTFQLL